MKTFIFFIALILTLPAFSQSGFYYSEQNTQTNTNSLMKNKNFMQLTKNGTKKERQHLARFFSMANSTSEQEAINLSSILLKAMAIHGIISKKEMNQTLTILTKIKDGKNAKQEFQMALEENPNGFVAIIFQEPAQTPTGQGLWQNIRRGINRIIGAFIGNNIGGGYGFITGGYTGMASGGIEGTSKGAALADKLSDWQDSQENGGGNKFKPGPNGEDCTDPRGWPANQ